MAMRWKIRPKRLPRSTTLATLMIAFFFKGGHKDLGCEFLHKSFREYLFAEAIVEALKAAAGERTDDLFSRRGYWKDYEPGASQFTFSRTLAELLSPQWLSGEVVTHLEHLLPWEIERAASKIPAVSDDKKRCVLPVLPMELWEQVRDRLADLWQWWGEGVHMRPQPFRDEDNGQLTLRRSYSEKLVDLDAPRDRGSGGRKLQPSRTTTMDAHLGDGLFRLTAILHFQIALHTGWLNSRQADRKPPTPEELWEGVDDVAQRQRPYQSLVRQGQERWLLFAPSGEDRAYFAHYVSRINAAGWRPMGVFPFGVDMSGVDFRYVKIGVYGDVGRSYRPSKWNYSNLSHADANSGWFMYNDFTGVLAQETTFNLTYLLDATFINADLRRSEFQLACAPGTSFTDADLSAAFMIGTAHVKQSVLPCKNGRYSVT